MSFLNTYYIILVVSMLCIINQLDVFFWKCVSSLDVDRQDPKVWSLARISLCGIKCLVYVMYMRTVLMLFNILLVSSWLRRPRLQLLRLRGPQLLRQVRPMLLLLECMCVELSSLASSFSIRPAIFYNPRRFSFSWPGGLRCDESGGVWPACRLGLWLLPALSGELLLLRLPFGPCLS